MANLSAAPGLIVVDKSIGSSGNSEIAYIKAGRLEDLWERTGPASWTFINVHLKTGQGDEADVSGHYTVTLKPGQIYQVAVFLDIMARSVRTRKWLVR